MGFSLDGMKGRDAARRAERAAGLGKRQTKQILRAARRALWEGAVIKTILEFRNEEQKALAAARLEETQIDMGEDEASRAARRAGTCDCSATTPLGPTKASDRAIALECPHGGKAGQGRCATLEQ